MKGNWSFCFLLYLFLFLFILGCSPKSPSPYFWKVAKENKESYLLGTYHFGVSLRELPCSKDIVNKIKSSDLVFLEVAGDDDVVDDVVNYISPDGDDFKELSSSSQKFLKEKRISNALNFLGFEV